MAKRLDSWKEIAAYLGRDPRSVQRWEKSEGLPVHRLMHGSGVSVYAVAAELDEWMAKRDRQALPKEASSSMGSEQSLGPEKTMLAVLPFVNLSGDAEQEYFSDGLTEELIAALGQLAPKELGVIARTTAMRYKETLKTAEQIGRELKVSYLLEGSVRRAGERVRITAQLIQVSDQTHLWAGSFDEDRPLSEVLAIQSDVAGRVAHSLALELLTAKPAAVAQVQELSRPEGYVAYLKGRHFWNRRGPEDLLKSVEFFQQAIAEDPASALAYAGLADSYNVLGFFNILPPRESYPKSKDAARRALQLDESLSQAHAALADALYRFDFDWAAADKEYRRAIELNPSYATAHQWYAVFLAMQGKLEEAQLEIGKALDLDPLSLVINTVVGMLSYYEREFDVAHEQLQTTLALDANFGLAHFWLARVYVQQSEFEKAFREFWKVIDMQPGDTFALGLLGHAYGAAGKPEDARKMIRFLNGLAAKRYVSAAMFSVIHTGLGETEQALEWMDKAFAEPAAVLTHLKMDPVHDAYRSDPRFQEFVRRVGLET